MKVVLFCGGLGTRLREGNEQIPKPLVNIGYRPIMWHLMRYYAHFGFKDFILNQGCDIQHPDLRNSGGFLETKRIADMAALALSFR